MSSVAIMRYIMMRDGDVILMQKRVAITMDLTQNKGTYQLSVLGSSLFPPNGAKPQNYMTYTAPVRESTAKRERLLVIFSIKSEVFDNL